MKVQCAELSEFCVCWPPLMESLQTHQTCWILPSRNTGDFSCVASWPCGLLHRSASFFKPHWLESHHHINVCVCVYTYVCIHTYIHIWDMYMSISVQCVFFFQCWVQARLHSCSVRQCFGFGLPSLPTHVLLNSENLQLYHVCCP